MARRERAVLTARAAAIDAGPGGRGCGERDRHREAGHDTRALQAWLGHKNIRHTVRYTELAPHRFKDFWR
jgi:type 1 fimbriae regulatory protein FimB/type 1 fimbriae regulatory protein FimE